MQLLKNKEEWEGWAVQSSFETNITPSKPQEYPCYAYVVPDFNLEFEVEVYIYKEQVIQMLQMLEALNA